MSAHSVPDMSAEARHAIKFDVSEVSTSADHHGQEIHGEIRWSLLFYKPQQLMEVIQEDFKIPSFGIWEGLETSFLKAKGWRWRCEKLVEEEKMLKEGGKEAR